MAEDDDADLRVALAQERGQTDAFVGVGGRHADVGHHHVRPALLDDLEKRVEVVAGGHHLDVVLPGKQLGDALTDEEVVLGQRHPDREGTRTNGVGLRFSHWPECTIV